MSLTQGNAVDLHSVGRVPQHSRRRSEWGGGGRIDPVKNMTLCDVLFSFITSLK
jgi:hypothetical protein